LQLGHGNFDNQSSLKPVDDLKGKQIIMTASGGGHSVAVDVKGEMYVWGGAKNAQNAQYATPHLLVQLKKKRVCAVACGSLHAIAVVEGNKGDSHEVYTW
jgi:alpha-tubulin suppressor-like RCC1 family protein